MCKVNKNIEKIFVSLRIQRNTQQGVRATFFLFRTIKFEQFSLLHLLNIFAYLYYFFFHLSFSL